MAQYVKGGVIPRSSHLNAVYMCQRREGMGDLQPFLKHLPIVTLLRSASELRRFTMR